MIAANLAFVVFVDVESMPHHRERIDREKGIGEGGVPMPVKHLMASVACTVPTMPANEPSTPTIEQVSTSAIAGGSGKMQR